MEKHKRITTLFVDIGGVLLSDGWDRNARKDACQHFHIDPLPMEEKHRINFETYELGKMTLNDYLRIVIFDRERSFSIATFKKFMFSQSKPFPKMLALIRSLKKKHKLKIAVLSNEGRELNHFRIQKFRLDDVVDLFVSSSFVHLRKPDMDIFKLALDLVQVPASSILYIENQPIFIAEAATLGISGIVHQDYSSTVSLLAKYGLTP